MAKKKLIACQIFADELLAVLPEVYKDIEITWLDPGLHMNMEKLETTIEQALKNAVAEGADARVLFGNGCSPEMCNIISRHGGKILGAKNCIDAFCHERVDELEQNRTVIMTPGWIRFFSNLMAEAGWDEVDVRQNWGRYDRILLLDTGVNPLSDEELLAFYDLIQVPIETQPTGLDYFREKLMEVLG
ncbi:hypothetical protein HRM2_24360 [Desulforapulum autotrophicum HRM2]|uniref:DUF1638 domain-containing protein n=1 Tax=Desulforapulum autotrophicum (strain ATCC 43914 / DSM 3382 / VKM B-1955 / HRM2) TaxID=177437 RepID=C0QFW2_DESAH|nr:DUF1638 domain-containing protein [Desulforapulum autotrophicum]ACN15530.1 hypothetical protein HRM2_24360 [Desulforapulum autotrophicum HRM2]